MKLTVAQLRYGEIFILNFTQIGQEIWQVRVEVRLLPYVNFDYHWDDFYKTRGYVMSFCEEILCWVSWKSAEEFGSRYWVTEELTWSPYKAHFYIS